MKDRLEEFVSKNRESFDMHEPDPSLWLKINPENKSKASKGKGTLKWLRYAAAVAVIFAGFSAGIYYLSGAKTNPQKLYGAMYQEIVETEAYYSGLVQKRYSELQPYLTSSHGIKESLDNDLNELDQIYAELKNDLKDNVANPAVIDAMIRNYRMKVEILEELLQHLKEMEKHNETPSTES